MLKCTRGASFALPSIFLFPTARGRPSCVSFNFLAHKYLFILFFLSGDKFIKFLQLVLHVISSHSIVHGCCWGWSLQRTNSLALNVRAVYQLYPMSGGGKSLSRAPHSHLFGVKIAQWIRSRCTGNCHHRVCASVSVRVCILWNKMNFPFLYFGVNKLEGSVVVTSVFGTHCHIGNHTMVAFQLAISHFECALRASHAKCYSVRPVSDCTKQHSAHVPSAMISLCGQSWEDLFFLVIFTDDSFFFFFLRFAIREFFWMRISFIVWQPLILVCIRYRCSSPTETMNSFHYFYYYHRMSRYIFASFLFAGRDSLSTTRIRAFIFPTIPNGTYTVRCLRLPQLLLINKTWSRQFGKWTTRNEWQMIALKWEIRRRSTEMTIIEKWVWLRGVWRSSWLASRDRKSLNQIFIECV